jgi:excisionase family DNA binding protein
VVAVVNRPVLLTASEAAAFLRLRESTLRDYSRRGLVPCIRIGRHVRYVESDLLGWLDGLKGGVEGP